MTPPRAAARTSKRTTGSGVAKRPLRKAGPAKTAARQEDFVIGIDLGGTEIKCGAYASDGRLLTKTVVPTRDGESARGRPAFVIEARRAVQRVMRVLGRPPTRIGVAAPGMAAPDGSCIAFLPNRLPGLENLRWHEALGFPDQIPVLNDAHAALLGEIWQGAARGRRDVVLLTLGTGIGGAMVVDGHLVKGHLGRAGHLGHMTVDCHGPPTITGTPGGIEVAIGNASLPARTGGRFSMTRDLAAAALAGDRFAQDVWHESVRALAAHIAGLICAFDPECVVIAGGLSELDGFLFDPLAGFLDIFEWRPRGHRVPILKATLGSWAGACGAARHCQMTP